MTEPLTPTEFVIAGHHAVEVWGYVHRQQLANRAQPPGGDWLGRLRANLLGYSGELLMARILGRAWQPVIGTGSRTSDLAGGYEIRTNATPQGGLRLFANDDPDRCYILVTGEPPDLQPAGWIYGRDGWPQAEPDPYNESRWVPRSALNPWRHE